MATIGLWLLLVSVLTFQACNVHAAAGEVQKSVVDDGLGEEVSKHEIHKRADDAGFILMPPITMRSYMTRPPRIPGDIDPGFGGRPDWSERDVSMRPPIQVKDAGLILLHPVTHRQEYQPGDYSSQTRSDGFILMPPVTMRSMNG